ncbi:MAG: hypothetical protein ACRCTQ_05550 [Brevinemataceae bacterium]
MKNIRQWFVLLYLIVSVAACQTKKDQEVEALAFRKAPTPRNETSNIFKEEFIKNVNGIYQVGNDGNQLTIDGSGNFKIGDIEFALHDAISSYQGIYVAANPVKNDNKILYTYHGFEILGLNLLMVPFREPTFEKNRRIDETESPFYWEINTFRPENIDWNSGMKTTFAQKNVSPN